MDQPVLTSAAPMRHSDPILTTDTYGHLDLGDLRRAINRIPVLGVGLIPARKDARTAPVPQQDGADENETPEPPDFSNDSGAYHQSGRQDLNLRPLGPEPSALPG